MDEIVMSRNGTYRTVRLLPYFLSLVVAQ